MSKMTHLTPWYPGTTKPVRDGVYERCSTVYDLIYARWEYGQWWSNCVLLEHAAIVQTPSWFQDDMGWRGLTDDSDDEGPTPTLAHIDAVLNQLLGLADSIKVVRESLLDLRDSV